MKTSSKAAKFIVNALKIGVVVVALTYLIGTGRLDPRTLDFQMSRLPFAVLTIVGIGLTAILSFVRWFILLKGVEARIPLLATFRLGYIGLFFNTFMLGGFGGDVIKLAYVVRETHKRAPAAASVILDRVCGLMGLLLLGGGAIILSWQEILATPALHLLALFLFALLAGLSMCLVTAGIAISAGRLLGLLLPLLALILQCLTLTVWRPDEIQLLSVYAHALTLAAIVGALLTAVITPSIIPGGSLNRFVKERLPLGHTLMSFVEALLAFRYHVGSLVWAVLLSMVIQAIALLSLAALAYSVGCPASVPHIFFAAPPAFLANVLPVPMGGLGVGEACFNNLLELCRTPEGATVTGGAAVFLGLRIIQNLWGICCGLPLYLRGKKEIDASSAVLAEEETDGDPATEPGASDES
ncbi:MAG: lysylphosphatidylglycerol synthase domain-containing protein [Planctomycetota bacterium]|jgi:uncharacterized membrane protein YbhN (UPF0104 family)